MSRNVRLSARMLNNVSLIDRGSHVADIGCDHGFVSIYLIEHKIADRVIAMDVGEQPLSQAVAHIREAGLEGTIETRLSDGMQALGIDSQGRPEVDTVLIAGMGGRLVVRIIENSLELAHGLKTMVLQPQSELEYVREQLLNMGFHIVDEVMTCEDGKYYTAMKVVTEAEEPMNRQELTYGRVLLNRRNPVLEQFLLREKNKFTGILKSMEADDGDKSISVREVSDKLKLVEEALDYYS